jgi:hypothetical protein
MLKIVKGLPRSEGLFDYGVYSFSDQQGHYLYPEDNPTPSWSRQYLLASKENKSTKIKWLVQELNFINCFWPVVMNRWPASLYLSFGVFFNRRFLSPIGHVELFWMKLEILPLSSHCKKYLLPVMLLCGHTQRDNYATYIEPLLHMWFFYVQNIGGD